MTAVELPALRSNDPLGFLAALGTVELCSTVLAMDVRLSWDGLGGQAVLDAPFADVFDLADRLASVAFEWQGLGHLMPPADALFVPPPRSTAERRERKLASGGTDASPLDPMRMLPQDAKRRFAAEQERELAGFSHGARWLAGLVNQVALEPNGDRCELTPLYARTGQQNLHQLYRDYREKIAARPLLVRAALTSWERIGGDSGANLDSRALRDGAAMGTGKPDNAAVPGATWLALMSVPFFGHVGDNGRPEAVGWRTVRRGGRPRELVWPVWRMPLDRAAIDVLLAHPEVTRVTSISPDDDVPGRLRVLGVDAVCAAKRSSLGNSDGPLEGARVVWSAS